MSEFTKCWYNSIALGSSDDGGETFTNLPPPGHLVATVPYRYQPDAGPYGLFQPSNIVLNPRDGYFYAFVRAQAFEAQSRGSCLLRTRRLRDPRSWRGWDGVDFTVSFVNPYRVSAESLNGRICKPVAPREIQSMTESLTYNTRFRKFMLVGVAAVHQTNRREPRWGFAFSLSDDLLHWTPRRLLAEVELPWTYRCGDRNPLLHPSVIDPNSDSRNFVTVDDQAYLYFVRFHYTDCKVTFNRDLVRVPISFSE